MTYQIMYLLGASGRQLADTDQIGDAELDRYPIPTWPEWATARWSDGDKTLYGYAGAWHRNPPREVLEYDREQQRKREQAELQRGLARMPRAIVDRVDTAGVSLTIDNEPRYVSRADLDAAASANQADPALRIFYRAIRSTAERWCERGRSGQLDRLYVQLPRSEA